MRRPPALQNVQYTVFVSTSMFKKGTPKLLLHGVSGHFDPGTMTALMVGAGRGSGSCHAAAQPSGSRPLSTTAPATSAPPPGTHRTEALHRVEVNV